jgi:hypothetical protein
MYMLSQYKGDVTTTGKDQAVANFLLYTLENTQLVAHDIGWACQTEAMFRSGPVENLEAPQPIVKDGIAYNSGMEPFVIFHQYERVPEFRDDVLRRVYE